MYIQYHTLHMMDFIDWLFVLWGDGHFFTSYCLVFFFFWLFVYFMCTVFTVFWVFLMQALLLHINK